ncbi:MAG TPA: flagellar hook capping FlgD N-terminal domain-containing protein [Rhizomicrobium sp.]|nr:flagellar hook capping FlgD N-terminal domain-containing protein [Rhizomicrobium sp.]
MAVAPVSPSSSAAFGLDFQSMLKIILTQLTYQDPLKPLDNFQFVSQLGQFAQLQQSQSLNDQITTLLTAQAASQAAGLLGKTVDVTPQNGTPTSGQVTAVTFASGIPSLKVTLAGGQILTNVSLADISQIRP